MKGLKNFTMFCLLIPSLVSAKGLIMETKVTGIYCGIYNGANMCSLYFDKESTTSPSCVGSKYKLRMQLNTTTEIGRAMLSLALTANASNKIVVVQGTGTCSIWPDTEDLNSIFISPSCSSTNTWGCTNT